MSTSFGALFSTAYFARFRRNHLLALVDGHGYVFGRAVARIRSASLARDPTQSLRLENFHHVVVKGNIYFFNPMRCARRYCNNVTLCEVMSYTARDIRA